MDEDFFGGECKVDVPATRSPAAWPDYHAGRYLLVLMARKQRWDRVGRRLEGSRKMVESAAAHRFVGGGVGS